MKHNDFLTIVQAAWNIPVGFHYAAKKINAKLKNVRRALKLWAKTLPTLKIEIGKLNELIFILDFLEEFRDLYVEEWNCRVLLKEYLLDLQDSQRIYWKKRGKINWVQLGDES